MPTASTIAAVMLVVLVRHDAGRPAGATAHRPAPRRSHRLVYRHGRPGRRCQGPRARSMRPPPTAMSWGGCGWRAPTRAGALAILATRPRPGRSPSSCWTRCSRQASRGVVEAVFLMGTAYDEGLGVAEDPAVAFGWFEKAAAAGHTLAEHNIGNAYAAGRGRRGGSGSSRDLVDEGGHQGRCRSPAPPRRSLRAGHGRHRRPRTGAALVWRCGRARQRGSQGRARTAGIAPLTAVPPRGRSNRVRDTLVFSHVEATAPWA